MDKRKLIGRRIKELRKARGVSQEAVAEKMGIDAKYLGFIEQGRGNPTLGVLIKLAETLRVEIDQLFNIRWTSLSDAEIRRKLRVTLDGAEGERLREMAALLRARDL